MSDPHPHTKISPGQRKKLVLGTVVLVIGFLSPFLILFVLKSNLTDVTKSVIIGLLAFGIPEVFMLVAIGIMGKSGYRYIKGRIAAFLKPMAPPDEVSPLRYKIGLALFSLPLLAGFLLPYIALYFPELTRLPLAFHMLSDLIFIISFFVLGGDFWDKLSGLFKHGVKVQRLEA